MLRLLFCLCFFAESSVTYTHRRSNSHGKIDSFLDIPNPVPIIQSVPSTPTTHTSPSSSTVSAYAVPRVTPLQRPHSSHLPHSQTAPYDLYEFDPMNMKQRSNSDDGTFLSSDERSSLTGLSHSVQGESKLTEIHDLKTTQQLTLKTQVKHNEHCFLLNSK